MTETLDIALPKGRLGEKVAALLARTGVACSGIDGDSRKLVLESDDGSVRFFWVKPADVPIYVERGAADMGVAGKDVLLESGADVYELLDLGLGRCRMCVAGKKDFRDNTGRTLKVATKFSNIAAGYYSNLCRDIDIIKLQGSIEIAPILGLSDVIVDIVETGTTLKENDLEVIDTIVDISARLISNKVSFKFKNRKIEKICADLRGLISKG